MVVGANAPLQKHLRVEEKESIFYVVHRIGIKPLKGIRKFSVNSSSIFSVIVAHASSWHKRDIMIYNVVFIYFTMIQQWLSIQDFKFQQSQLNTSCVKN